MPELTPQSPTLRRLYAASWAIVLYTVVIIAWGAWVRISGSGDGCGDNWPLCHGEAIPLGAPTKTWIEVSHRYSTALFGVFVLAQLFAIRRFTQPGNSARRWVWWTLFFTLTEALIGRLLVKQGLVNESESLRRLIVMPLHLINTSLLLFSEVMTAESILRHGWQRLRINPRARRWIWGIGFALLLLLTTGAIAALGSHLAPSESLMGGLLHELSADAHLAVRLRILHPILGLALPLTVWLIIQTTVVTSDSGRSAATRRACYKQLIIATWIMVAVGVLTLLTLAPAPLKLAHLTLANLLVIMATRAYYHSTRAAPLEE